MMAKKKPYALGVVLVHYVKRGRIQLDSKMYPAPLVKEHMSVFLRNTVANVVITH